MPAPSEMVERVKGAIMTRCRDLGVSFSGGEIVSRAAIAAMREPTTEMLDAGELELRGTLDWRETTSKMWHAMIDAALAEKETQ